MAACRYPVLCYGVITWYFRISVHNGKLANYERHFPLHVEASTRHSIAAHVIIEAEFAKSFSARW
jgi:hypothetical protein